MAGGSGERFWPLSRKKKPKQLLKLASADKMMIEESIDRISGIIEPDDIFIITSSLLQEPIRESLSILPPENIVAEPFKRNTAPCLALSASVISAKYSDLKSDEISIAVLTADQSIAPIDGFRKTVNAALEYVENNPVLCTIGIPPVRPETGYGYIQAGRQFNPDSDKIQINPAVRFTEKPDIETAQKFVDSGDYLWNSGMFFWRLDTFIDSMTKCLPEVGGKINTMADKYSAKDDMNISGPLVEISATFEAFPNTSIDYGLMEKAENVVVAAAAFNWDDIGSWDSLPRIRETDENNNVLSGNTAVFDLKDSVIINEGGKDIMVSAFGLDNIVVVVTGDSVMVCPKDRVQEVKRSVEIIRDASGEKWL